MAETHYIAHVHIEKITKSDPTPDPYNRNQSHSRSNATKQLEETRTKTDVTRFVVSDITLTKVLVRSIKHLELELSTEEETTPND